MDTLYIVMPAYNEEANIENVVRSWYPLLTDKNPRSRLVVADSGSTDATHDILLRLQHTLPSLEILSDTDRYHGPKVWALYDHAIRSGADYIFQTDSDGQTSPDEFASFWAERDRYDIILGNRTVRGDGKARAFIEKVVVFLLRIYFGAKIPDANAPFRLMRSETVKKYLYLVQPDFNIPNIILTTFFCKGGERVRFKEISFAPRQGGENSINVRNIIGIGMQALKDFSYYRKIMRQAIPPRS
ncbi:MAG: glycosyltransferase family 2 protein [Blautia sp.]|nr:glycosyltransferase family 2 protein [Blautia sp.]